MSCEDFPCCGHERGHCPRIDSRGRERWRCVECDGLLPVGARSSICARCQREANQRFNETGEMWGDE